MSRIVRASQVVFSSNEKMMVSDGELKHADKVQAPVVAKDVGEDITNAREQASKLITKAGNEANQILDRATRESDAIIRKAREQATAEQARIEGEAREKGYSEGFAGGEKEAERVKAEAKEILENAITEKQRIFDNMESDVVDLILSVVQKLIGNMAAINESLIVNLIKQGLSDATITGEINIKVSKDDYDAVVASKDEIVSLAEGAKNVEIVKDMSLSKSDCVIETPFGIIDSSLDRQFAILKESLYFILNNATQSE